MSISLAAAPATAARPTTSRSTWAGRALSGIAVLFLTFDAGYKLFASWDAIDPSLLLGFQPHHMLTIGLIEVVCLALYLAPRTAVLGALLWTGYLGGAIATHFRLDNPLFTHTIFPLYVAALIWGGLYLRDARVRALVK
jgi:hypothetical protein